MPEKLCPCACDPPPRAQFCTSKYHVNFPMFSKVEVNGPHTHPVYAFLKKELPLNEGGGGGTGPGKDLIWNFQVTRGSVCFGHGYCPLHVLVGACACRKGWIGGAQRMVAWEPADASGLHLNLLQKILVNHEGKPIKLLYQEWDQSVVEQAVYAALHAAREAGTIKAAAS